MELTVYLSGEIHTNWRKEIIEKCNQLNLPIDFYLPLQIMNCLMMLV